MMIESKRVNEELSTGLHKILEDNCVMNALVVHMAETDRRASVLNIELDQSRGLNGQWPRYLSKFWVKSRPESAYLRRKIHFETKARTCPIEVWTR